MKLPEKALEAIQKGIENGDYICDLEELGLDQRRINLLNEEGNIHTLEDLMFSSKEKLLSIKNFGPESLKLVFNCLAIYDQLDELRTIRPLEEQRRSRTSL